MLRKLIAAAAVLFCVAGLSLAATASAEAKGVTPTHGTYTGMDHNGNTVSFDFSGNQMSRFKVGHQSIGGAHVSNGMWHETCHNGYCTKGQWQLDYHVVGHWRTPGGHWTAFYASAPQPPHQGDYMGSDHQGNGVHVSFHGTRVHDFTVNGYGDFPEAHISNGAWHEVCSSAGWCFRGRFQSPSTVVGEWRTRGSVWHAWEAYAYSF